MNKNIKKIIGLVLAFGIFASVMPESKINILTTTKAYAKTNDESEFESLYLDDSDGNSIRLYEDNDYDKIVSYKEVEPDTTYYAKTSSKTISIDISGVDDDYVRIFKGNSDSARGKKPGDDITLDDDSVVTVLTIKVYGEDTDGKTVRNNDSDDDKYDLLNTYEIKVRKSKEVTEDDYDDIYLDRLSIAGSSINLSDNKTEYTYNVPLSKDKVSIRATPQNDNYSVSIDGKDAEYDDNYTRTVNLEEGQNKIKVELYHRDKLRVYNLIINRGEVKEDNSTSDNTDKDNTSNNNADSNNSENTNGSQAIKINQWVLNNGNWQYFDASGKAIKNSWIQNYYVDADGNMTTGWAILNGNWYYFGTDGKMATGWQFINGNWYYLDSQGIMQVGWFKDINGKYYYLNKDGSMAYDTKIGSYKLGKDGAWIK